MGPNLGLRKLRDACKVLQLKCAPVAQLDRAFDYESKGRKFESCRAHQKYLKTQQLAAASKTLKSKKLEKVST
jgi:hypothetical protein